MQEQPGSSGAKAAGAPPSAYEDRAVRLHHGHGGGHAYELDRDLLPKFLSCIVRLTAHQHKDSG